MTRAALTRHWMLIAFITLSFLGLGAAWAAQQDPTYRATSTVAMGSGSADTAADIESELAAAGSEVVRSEFGRRLFDTSGVIAAGFEPEIENRDDQIDITFETVDPGIAQLLSQTYAEALIEARDGVAPKPVVPYEVVTEATFPDGPAAPNLRRVALITGALGLAAGSLVALTLSLLRPTTELAPSPATPIPESLAEGPELALRSWLDDPVQAVEATPEVERGSAPGGKISGADRIGLDNVGVDRLGKSFRVERVDSGRSSRAATRHPHQPQVRPTGPLPRVVQRPPRPNSDP